MTLSPAQLRSLMGPEGLHVSQGWLADELGWVGDNATRRIARLQDEGAEIPLSTAKHVIRIAREYGFELVDGEWRKVT